MNLGGYTATGPREANEDSFYVIDFSDVDSFTNGIVSFVMVSDGMGGYQGGDIASGLAVSSAENYIAQLLEMAEGNQIELKPEVALNEIAQNANEAILLETQARGNASMGATFVGAFVSPTHAWIGHVGDSRAYLVRNGEAMQITEDHSQVGRMLSRGLITEEEAQNHPARNRIERALGFSDATPEMNEVDLLSGDALLLCSDGVYTVLDKAAICECVVSARNAENAAKRVVKSALGKGTDDNSTAAVAINITVDHDATGKRRSMPTIRTKAVSAPQHADAGGYQAERYRADRYQAKRKSVARRDSGNDKDEGGPGRRKAAKPAGKYSFRVLAISVAVAVAVAVGATAVYFSSAGQERDTGTPSGQASSASVSSAQSEVVSSSQSTSTYNTNATGVSSATSQRESTSYGSMREYRVVADSYGSAPELRCISGGTTYLFGAEDSRPLVDDASDALPIYMQPNTSTVRASTVAESYNREPKTYHRLDDKYLVQLKADVANMANGSQTSELAQMIPNYPQLLNMLSSQESLLTTINGLALEESSLQAI